MYQEKPISPSTPNDTTLLIVDKNEQEVHEDENELIQPTIDLSCTTNVITSKNLTEKTLSDPYILPTLPSQVNDAINLKQMETYPTREQYAVIVNGILNHLKIERDTKTVASIIQDTPNEIQQMEEKAETLKTNFQNKSIDD
ncbi:unnamed protein product [Rotaria sp. Silwood1]|nr:unnamed protein product [Rotaria sp. Silwood1]CAF1655827.1 unnamed protein product [Rotaria sp. Silwood1]CAF3790484.1 unnamed protein product [Rotaria sp. Silwood1]CAF3811613.1 unnamed protein product [Rotaria sp. Silwood1]CAF3852011.1 unnamed protein product [Rotaria sp. Silwood1]